MKKPIIIISVLCIIALALGYWSGQGKEEVASGGNVKSSEKKEPEFLKKGLVAYYPFNGNAKDESGNGNDGILKGAKPKFIIQPSVGNGFKITRDSWVEIPHSEAINPKGSRTISFFFQGDEEGRIFSNRHEQIARNWNFNFLYEKGLIEVAFFENFSRAIRLRFQLPDLKNIYHYTITLNTLTGSFRAYINGEITAQDPFEFKDPNDTVHRLGENDLIGFSNSQGVVPLEIGRDAAYPTSAIDTGFISALRFYDRALSADEVKALYEFEKGSGQEKRGAASGSVFESSEKKEPEFLRDGLVAYYPFDGSLKDESGNGNDGGGSLTSFSSDRNGRPNKSYLFKNDIIQLNNRTLIDNSVTTENNMSVSFWAAKSTKGVVISQYWQGYSERTNMMIVLARPESTMVVYGNGKDAFQFKFVPSSFNWNQWVVAYNSAANNVTVYMNGNLIAAGKVTLNSNASATGFLLGSTHNPTPGDRLEGELDDLRIYNRALSAVEVKALYEFEKAN